MKKIDKRKKYVLVMDVETTGGFGCPLVYDLGFAICDKKGNIYEERSFVIEEIFQDVQLMKTAYYAEKIPQYIEELKTGKRTMISFLDARAEMFQLMKEYNVNTISAYNLAFDRRALGKTTEFLYGSGKKFLGVEHKSIEQLCIWSLACELLYTRPTFWKVAEKQNWFTPAGNMKTSAEIGWRYISKDYDFIEEHTGLEDVKIEVQILAKCFAQHKNYESGVLPHPWRIPNNAKNNK